LVLRRLVSRPIAKLLAVHDRVSTRGQAPDSMGMTSLRIERLSGTQAGEWSQCSARNATGQCPRPTGCSHLQGPSEDHCQFK
jgi:hypothetical protein